MKVIGAGMGRTGTLSLKAALERLLGGRCYHMEEVVRSTAQLRRWHAWSRGQAIDLPAVFAGFAACVDAPACFFYERLMALYPDAPVILTVRDPERWFRSWQALWASTRATRWLGLVSPRMRMMHEFTGVLRDRYFGGVIEREANIAAFEAHNRRVQEVVPAGRLLVFSVTEGWGPLCEFLGLPAPDEPFPRLNAGTRTVRRVMREMAFRRER